MLNVQDFSCVRICKMTLKQACHLTLLRAMQLLCTISDLLPAALLAWDSKCAITLVMCRCTCTWSHRLQ